MAQCGRPGRTSVPFWSFSCFFLSLVLSLLYGDRFAALCLAGFLLSDGLATRGEKVGGGLLLREGQRLRRFIHEPRLGRRTTFLVFFFCTLRASCAPETPTKASTAAYIQAKCIVCGRGRGAFSGRSLYLGLVFWLVVLHTRIFLLYLVSLAFVRGYGSYLQKRLAREYLRVAEPFIYKEEDAKSEITI